MRLNQLVKEVSLKPYPGRLFITNTREKYEEAHVKLFGEKDQLDLSQSGRFSGVDSPKGWTYLLYFTFDSTLVHELSHIVLHIFELIKVDPRDSEGEPFCYMLGHLFDECSNLKFD